MSLRPEPISAAPPTGLEERKNTSVTESEPATAERRAAPEKPIEHAVAENAAPAVTDPGDSGEQNEMPLPRNPQTVFLGGLFLLACLTAMYLARDIVLPLVVALILKLFLQPVVRLLSRARVPRALGALMAVVLFLLVFVGLGTLVGSPASEWAAELPAAMPRLLDQFKGVQAFVHHGQQALDKLGLHLDLTGAGAGLSPATMAGSLLDGTSTVASHMLEILLILFYLLVFGETFLRRLVEILPTLAEKREAVALSTQIEQDLSAYLLTVTAINAVVGCATALAMWVSGVPGAILWGVVAFAVNYIPILGPICAVVLFIGVGLVVKGVTWFALLPAALYLGIHIAEGEIFTPMLLARRFTINPVAVILALVFWYWLWGVVGAVLAVPLLAVMKIVCDRIRPFRAFGHLLEG
jgi:predicted PurR-regulated permease PerM